MLPLNILRFFIQHQSRENVNEACTLHRCIIVARGKNLSWIWDIPLILWAVPVSLYNSQDVTTLASG